MTRYSIELRYRIFVKGYAFLPFAKNIEKIYILLKKYVKV